MFCTGIFLDYFQFRHWDPTLLQVFDLFSRILIVLGYFFDLPSVLF